MTIIPYSVRVERVQRGQHIFGDADRVCNTLKSKASGWAVRRVHGLRVECRALLGIEHGDAAFGRPGEPAPRPARAGR